jgi:RimJ/RimL family protein N-acetyltransferase
MKIQLFVPQSASEKDWDNFFTHRESINKEIHPNDPPPSRENVIKFILDPHPHYETLYWVAISKSDKTIIGLADMDYINQNSPDYETNKNIANVNISVNKTYRRQGIGSSLLKILVARALSGQKTILQSKFHIESGRVFSMNFGATITSERYQRRLYINDVDWNHVEQWIKESRMRASGISVEIFERIPGTDLEEYCRVYNETGLQTPEFETGDFVQSSSMTPQFRRDTEKVAKEKGGRWVTLWTRESDGTISGFTEIDYNPCYPHFLEQGMTGVLHDYRGSGRGILLKAEMLKYIRRAFPKMQFIIAGNDNGNEGILHINSKLGFKKDLADKLVTLDVLNLKDRLGL